MIRDPLLIAALIAATTALAFWLDHRFAVLSKIGAALIAIFLGALLANLGIVPQDSPVYSTIEGPVVSLAIVYLLLSVRLGDLKNAGPMMVALFALASIGTALEAGRYLHRYLHGRQPQLRSRGPGAGIAGAYLRRRRRSGRRNHGAMAGHSAHGPRAAGAAG